MRLGGFIPVAPHFAHGCKFGLMMGTLLSAPALVGAAVGGWGVAASALAYGVIASQFEDTSEYPGSQSGGVMSSAVLGGVLAAVGATAGLAGAAVCGGLGLGMGGLLIYTTWEKEKN